MNYKLFEYFLLYQGDKISVNDLDKLETLDNYEFPLKTNGEIKFSTKIYTNKNYSYKHSAGDEVGKLHLYNNGNLLCEAKIFLDNNLSKNSFVYYLKAIFKVFK